MIKLRDEQLSETSGLEVTNFFGSYLEEKSNKNNSDLKDQ